MSYKSLFVPMSGAERDRTALDAALIVARRFGAHLLGLYARPTPESMVPYVGDGGAGLMVQDMIDSARRDADERAARAGKLFREACRDLPAAEAPPADGPTAAWREEEGREADLVARHGRLADLTVLARNDDENDVEGTLAAEAALFDTGRPLLLAPPELPGRIGETVVIAWDGSVQAARAVAAAMPFLASAKAVTAMTVTERGSLPAKPEALAAALGWHGISVTPKTVEPADGGVGPALLDATRETGADLLVMGGYGQSRLRELILGGATRETLRRSPVPTLLCH